MEELKIKEIRDGFDELFLGSSNEITEKSQELFKALGIEYFADILARSKKYGFNVSQKILADLVKLSFVVYSNLEKLPLQKKVILPKESGSYKFIVMSLPDPFLRGDIDDSFKDEDTNVIFLVSTGDKMHVDVAEKAGLNGKYCGKSHVLGGAWIDVDYENKVFAIHSDSGHYGSCSDQIVEWLLEEHKDQGYKVETKMSHQGNFFKD